MQQLLSQTGETLTSNAGRDWQAGVQRQTDGAPPHMHPVVADAYLPSIACSGTAYLPSRQSRLSCLPEQHVASGQVESCGVLAVACLMPWPQA